MLPRINTLVRVAVGSSENPADGLRAAAVPSRVEDVEDITDAVDAASGANGVGAAHVVAPLVGAGVVPRLRRRVLVATPRFRGDVEEPAPGTACTLTWTTAQGVVELPVAFDLATARTSDPAVLRHWWLVVTGEAVRVQRRDWFRCPVALPVTLAGLTGRTTDLGEGGLRCLLAGPPPGAGTPVDVWLGLDDAGSVDVPGSVVRANQAARAPDHADTIVRFDDPDATGDAIRRVLFAEQLRLRRLGLG